MNRLYDNCKLWKMKCTQFKIEIFYMIKISIFEL